MINRSQVLEIVEKRGPILPREISRDLRENLIIVSAMLSELVSVKKIKISNMKIGSSPLYYFEGQEKKLQDFFEKLPSSKKNIFTIIKQEKLLKDSLLSPSDRLSIRELKDFAYPVIIKLKDRKELFWKWYLSPTEEIHEIIQKKFIPQSPTPIVKKPEPPILPISTIPSIVLEPDIPIELSEPNFSNEPQKEKMPSSEESLQKVFVQKTIHETPEQKKFEASTFAGQSKIEDIKSLLDKERKKLDEERKKFFVEKQELEKQKKEMFEIKKSVPKEPTFEDDLFYKEISIFIHDMNLPIKEVVIEKKSKELSFKTEISSDIGKIPFIVKANSKKRITSNDLEELNSLSLQKKSPVLFMFKGTPSKKIESELKNYPLLKLLEIKEKEKIEKEDK